MPNWNNYWIAGTIIDALTALRSSSGSACPVAGGTDLLIELQQGHHQPVDTLVDVSRIPDLTCLNVRGNNIFIGAAVPVAEVTSSPLILEHAQAVSEACGLIGGPQVRNTATLGGNVAHALPAADGMIALAALDALAEIAYLEGEHVNFRRVPLLSLFRGPGKSTLIVDREILTGFYIPILQKGSEQDCSFASAFGRVMRPQGVALPILNVAVWLKRVGDEIRDIRISVGPAGPVPQRAILVENIFRGSNYTSSSYQDLMKNAAMVWLTGLRFRSSPQRATAQYRHHLSQVLFERVMNTAWQRAGGLSVEG